VEPGTEGAVGRSTVGVVPPGFLAERARLFSALSVLADADFVGRAPGEHRGLTGAIVAGDADAAAELVAAGVHSLRFQDHAEPDPDGPTLVRLASGQELDERLRGRAILETRVASLRSDGGGPASVLASSRAGALWRARALPGGMLHDVAAAPQELAEGERLKDRLRSGRFASLLPVVQFLRNLGPRWERPPLRASFILDDANLHWPSYGYIPYCSLADHAAAHGYHVGVAMIPLDGWLAHPGAARVFTPGSPLALLVHGNNHTSHELGRPRTDDEARWAARTALSRVRAFEARTGLAVQRVMSPPHGALSEPMMRALTYSGFEGTCYWGPTDETPPTLVGWSPADIHLGEGLPGAHRAPVDAPLDELALRAFLDQALLLSGHHGDLATGLDVLGDACRRVSLLGSVRWTSASDALASNFLRRREGDVLRLRPFARRLRVHPPEGVSALVVEWTGAGRPSWEVSAGGAGVRAGSGEQVPLPGGGPLEIRQLPGSEVDAAGPGAAPWRPWPVARRCLTEGRDRFQRVLRPVRTFG
jgi:hypothetical protein